MLNIYNVADRLMILESCKANTLNRTATCFNIKRNKIAGGQEVVRSSIILCGLNDFVSELRRAHITFRSQQLFDMRFLQEFAVRRSNHYAQLRHK